MVSIIVPVYNTDKFLHRCIDSILAQTYTDFELLLIDDGSKDSSGTICDEYAAKDVRVRVFHKENGGVSSARNMGLDNARGEWITFVDSDDWIDDNYLEALYGACIVSGSDIVFCGFRVVDKKILLAEKLPIIWQNNKSEDLNKYILCAWTSVWASLQRKSLYVDNAVRFLEGISYREDFHVMVRLLLYAKKVTSIYYFLYNYLQHSNSLLHKRNEKMLHDELIVCNDVVAFFKCNGLLDVYKKSMSWNILRISQDLILDPLLISTFKICNYDNQRYIWSCPYIGYKIKILAWLLYHRGEMLVQVIVKMRKLYIGWRRG